MKVLLVRVINNYECNNFTHPLGIMYLSAYLKKHSDYEVRLRDQRGEMCALEDFVEDAAAWRPDVLGISAMTAEARKMYELAAKARERLPGVVIVAGGAHASAFTEECVEEAPIDYAVVGEGEETFLELLRRLEHGERTDDVAGVCFRGPDGKGVRNPAREYVANVDDLPFPDWDAIDLSLYHDKPTFDLMKKRKTQMSVFTSRACPYGCTYCHNVFGKVFRARSPESVLAEMEVLYRRYGVREFLFLDDIFNIDAARAKEIARRIVASGMDATLIFPNGLKADLMDDELLHLLHEAGLERLAYAIETASPRLQRMIDKGLDLPKVFDVIRKTTRLGIVTRGFFMIGLPTETREEIEATIEWARRSDLIIASFVRAQPFKGTKLQKQAEAMGHPLTLDYEQYNYDYSNTNLSEVSDAELAALHKRAYRRFYTAPKHLWLLLRRLPMKGQFWSFLRLWRSKITMDRGYKAELVHGA